MKYIYLVEGDMDDNPVIIKAQYSLPLISKFISQQTDKGKWAIVPEKTLIDMLAKAIRKQIV